MDNDDDPRNKTGTCLLSSLLPCAPLLCKNYTLPFLLCMYVCYLLVFGNTMAWHHNKSLPCPTRAPHPGLDPLTAAMPSLLYACWVESAQPLSFWRGEEGGEALLGCYTGMGTERRTVTDLTSPLHLSLHLCLCLPLFTLPYSLLVV